MSGPGAIAVRVVHSRGRVVGIVPRVEGRVEAVVIECDVLINESSSDKAGLGFVEDSQDACLELVTDDVGHNPVAGIAGSNRSRLVRLVRDVLGQEKDVTVVEAFSWGPSLYESMDDTEENRRSQVANHRVAQERDPVWSRARSALRELL